MKPLKSKKAMVASIILASVALGGVGFSAWVINAGNDIEEPKNVSVEVGKSTDNRFTLTPPQLAEDEKVVFDCDDYKGTVVAGSGTKLEDLSFTFSTTLTGNIDQLAGIYLRLNESDNLSKLTGTGVAAIIQTPVIPSNTGNGVEIIPKKAFTNATGTKVDSTEKFTAASSAQGGSKWSYTVTKVDSSYNISVTVNFAWGQLFNYANPTRLTEGLTADQITGLNTLTELSTTGFDLAFVVGAIASTAASE